MDIRKTLLIGALLFLSVALLYPLSIFVPSMYDGDIRFQVKKGESFGAIAERLQDDGLIRSSEVLKLIAKLTGIEGKIKSGEYRFRGRLSPYVVLKALVSGRVVLYEVTIPEGYNIWQIGERLEEAGIIKSEEFLEAAFNRELLEKMGVDAPSFEGYLFPDTYRFPKNPSPERIIMDMVTNTRRHISPEMLKRADELGLTENKLLTLASIIEKETGVDEERPVVSAVFHNRLKRGMLLQSDPTAVYGAKGLSEGVTSADLRRPSPYNTYLNKGLPPGPICSPGLSSIRAALYPADVDYLFFVSKRNGRHYFSRTEAEHLRAVNRFLRRRR
ncbi:MAG: endolytic transglycosylase MltG [Nitrospirae bacterium]|nr:MAG: endolytic transglycosylase MltG [Nitrospirota bacterium]